MGNILHDKVFEFIEEYRSSHPDFYYWLRERNTKNRFEQGCWFQGTEIYASVGLYNSTSGNQATKSFSLVFRPRNENFSVDIEIIFKKEKDAKVISFYKEAMKLIGGFKEESPYFYRKFLSDADPFAVAENFLNQFKEPLDKLIKKHNIEHLFIDPSDFNHKLQRVLNFRQNMPMENDITYIMVNITWNSNDWQNSSDDKSGHRWVTEGNTPHESWNFDFDNNRNTTESIYGSCQFTHPPKVEGDNNLIIFYSKNQIVGFYGKAQVLPSSIKINKNESYNLIGSRPLCVLLKNKITSVKEKGYLENKERVGMVGFIYLNDDETIASIINEAITLNPDDSEKLVALQNWLNLHDLPEPNYWIFQGNPKTYDTVSSLRDNALKRWRVNAHKNKIKVGDKVILWITGTYSGCYALCTVLSAVEFDKDDEDEIKYYFDKSSIEEHDGVQIRIDYNLWDRPVLIEKINELPAFNNFNVGYRGTNFTATKEQYITILNLIIMDSTDHSPKNQILFGPPGTGKTYHTVTEAIKIVDNQFYKDNADDRDKLQTRFNNLIIKDFDKTEGQISFCTFHQSFSYEDFVEGIKPLEPKEEDTYLKYKVVDGIFKNICRLADASNNAQILSKENLVAFSQDEFNKAVFYKISLGDSSKDEDKEIYDYCISNKLISVGFAKSIDFSGKDEEQVYKIIQDEKLDTYSGQAINYFKNYLKVGNYIVVSYGNNYIRALGKVVGEYEYRPDAEIRYKHFRKVEWIFKDVEIPVSEFYQKNLSQQTIYKLKSEFIIPSFFIHKKKPSENINDQKKFVLIIDEINRGNVSSIFGELITLIEPSKRAGKPEALEVVLPYSKSSFSVPSNVYIVGTMNTADRSIESLDTALRRRFSFKEMTSNPDLIKTVGKSKGYIDGIDLVLMLQKMNERIEKLIDKDHKIGHSYFLNITTLEHLQWTFKDRVIPLLEEYFYGDFGKIGLVLGESFIRKEEIPDFEFANFEDYDSQTQQDLKLRSVYKIKDIEDWDYKSIYEPKPKL